MGATLWHHEVPWHPDVAAAFRALQAAEFQWRYDFRGELDRWRRDSEEALRAAEEDGDLRLAAIYSAHLNAIREAAARPAPGDVADQIAILRRVRPEGFGSILDLTGVDRVGRLHVMRVLMPDEIAALFGTERPMLRTVNALLPSAANRIGRGESIAFPAYDDTGKPTHWLFLGNTVD